MYRIGLLALGLLAILFKLGALYRRSGRSIDFGEVSPLFMVVGWTLLAALWTVEAHTSFPVVVEWLLLAAAGMALLISFLAFFFSDREIFSRQRRPGEKM